MSLPASGELRGDRVVMLEAMGVPAPEELRGDRAVVLARHTGDVSLAIDRSADVVRCSGDVLAVQEVRIKENKTTTTTAAAAARPSGLSSS